MSWNTRGLRTGLCSMQRAMKPHSSGDWTRLSPCGAMFCGRGALGQGQGGFEGGVQGIRDKAGPCPLSWGPV
jgi:hypothetical protein